MSDSTKEMPGFTIRAVVISVALSLFLLASTMYIALKLGIAPALIVMPGISFVESWLAPIKLMPKSIILTGFELTDIGFDRPNQMLAEPVEALSAQFLSGVSSV